MGEYMYIDVHAALFLLFSWVSIVFGLVHSVMQGCGTCVTSLGVSMWHTWTFVSNHASRCMLVEYGEIVRDSLALMLHAPEIMRNT